MDFPTPILLEIFFRLPIYATIRCKIVCKSWFNLLSDPYFTNECTRNPPFTAFFLSEKCLRNSTDCFLLEFSEECGNYIRTPITIRPRLPDRLEAESALFVIGSSKGLLCLCEHKFVSSFVVETVYITNPITSECVALPQHRARSSDESFILYEFGFSPSTNKFKVVRFVYTSVQPDNEKVEIEVFTVGVDCGWRCLEEPSLSISFSFWPEGITFNGAYHWIKRVDRNCHSICTFDLGKEKEGRDINPPPLLPNIWSTRLASLNNHLCLVNHPDSSHIAIWTMNEFGVDSFWTKDVILQSWFPSPLCFEKLFPIAMLRNGAILLKDFENNCIIFCDPKQKKSARVKVIDVEGASVSLISVNTYAPGFSSLKELIMRGQ